MMIMFFTKPILSALGQQEEVIEHANSFILSSLASVYLLGMYDLEKRFLNCLRTTWVPMVACVGANLLHILWCHIFVTVLGWDLYGLGFASTLTAFILHSSIIVYSHCLKDIREALFWPDATVWTGWREYFSLGVPTTAMLCAEYWAWQFLAIVSGNLGVEAQATMMITMQVAALSETISLGIQEAACVLVGN